MDDSSSRVAANAAVTRMQSPRGPLGGDGFSDPSRRTYLALERTLLAWWRTAFSSAAVALAVGRLLPDIAHLPRDPYLALGAGYAVLSLGFAAIGVARFRVVHDATRAGGFHYLSRGLLYTVGTYIALLGIGTIVLLFLTG